MIVLLLNSPYENCFYVLKSFEAVLKSSLKSDPHNFGDFHKYKFSYFERFSKSGKFSAKKNIYFHGIL